MNGKDASFICVTTKEKTHRVIRKLLRKVEWISDILMSKSTGFYLELETGTISLPKEPKTEVMRREVKVFSNVTRYFTFLSLSKESDFASTSINLSPGEYIIGYSQLYCLPSNSFHV